MTTVQIAKAIDHTLLKPEATPEQIDALCDEALRFGFGAICVSPIYVRQVAKRLAAVSVGVAGASAPAIVTVVGFPLGATLTVSKVDEARRALDDGATEIDMAIPLGALVAPVVSGRDGRRTVRQDIEAVAHVVHEAGRSGVLKVILETAALTTDQIILGCRCAAEGEADFVKTSTGFHPSGGATVEHVRLLHRYASPLLVKASGGIRTAAAARAMLEAGAARLGTSSGPAIMGELR